MPRAQNPSDGMVDTWGRKNRKLEDRKCPACGTIFRPKRAASKYCSRPCLWSKNGGHNKKEETWWKNQNGYIEGRIWISDSEQIRVKKHRWIVEGIIGRPLTDDEDVHHINHIRDDNRPENLEILSKSDHTKLHNSEREYRTGYKLNLSESERRARSLRAIEIKLSNLGRAAIAKATGEAQ